MSNYDTRREVTGIVLFFCAVALTLMYYLPELTGKAGELMRALGFGLIGRAAFMIPLFLFYASIDFFLEKRKGVAPVRVRSVIMLMVLVAAIFAVSTMDFDYFKLVCTDSDGKAKATKAISRLWESGYDKSLVKNPTDSGLLLTGGLLGGGIATSLYTIAGRVLSILAIIVFLLSQVILIFHVSLKQTARKTASMISNAAANRRANPNVRRRPEYADQYPHSQPQRRPSPDIRPQNPSALRPQVKSAGTTRNDTIKAAGTLLGYDPFNTRIPVDRKSGFIDVSAEEFGADTSSHPGVLSYENRTVSTEGSEVTADTDFSYTPTPKNAPLRQHRNKPELSFLQKDSKEDFYDLGDGSEHIPFVEAGVGFNNRMPTNDPEPAVLEEDDLPYEIEDDGYGDPSTDPYSYHEPEVNEEAAIRPRVRRAEPVLSDEMIEENNKRADDIREDITINAGGDALKEQGFSALEGRIFEGAENKPASNNPAEHIEIASTSEEKKHKVVRMRRGAFKPYPISRLPQIGEDPVKNPNENIELKKKAVELEDAIQSFGINTKVINITHGPAITRFELTIDRGVKVSRILNLQDDIALAMAAVSVRIEAPIPGKSAIGIEIPNKKTYPVGIRSLLDTKAFRSGPPLEVALGKDIPGNLIMCDIAKMPHLLIAGSTGSGKSVCINTILISILCKASPDEVKMILIDPKVVELSIYQGIPHLLGPVVTEAKKAANALREAVAEMERRYKLFAENHVRDLKGCNEVLVKKGERALPLILVVIDELADLMTVAAKEVEDYIARLAAMARAAGIHMIIATQRPSVDVITGVIKANVPSRIAFAVSSGVDSRTILDSVGAEKLLGKGDMLYAPVSAPKPVRGQGAFVQDDTVQEVVEYFKKNYQTEYDEDFVNAVNTGAEGSGSGAASAGGGASDEDDLLNQAVEVVIDAGNASVSILQRRLGIGYPRAARLIDVLEKKKIIGPFEGSKPRKVLITRTDWLEMQSSGQE